MQMIAILLLAAAPGLTAKDWDARCAGWTTPPAKRCPAADTSEDDGTKAMECLLCALHRCAAVEGIVWRDQGSLRLKIDGPRAGRCQFALTAETEQGAFAARCRSPVPVVPWSGLLGDDPLGTAPAAIRQGCRPPAPRRQGP
jgi:hypothetical protein